MTDIAAMIEARLNGPADDSMLRYHGAWISRGWVRDFVRALDAQIDALGLEPSAPIGFAPQTSPEFIAAMLALIARGRSIVMIYAYQSSEAMARKLAELKLPVVIAASRQWPGMMLEAARETGTAAIAVSLDAPLVETLSPYLSECEHRPAPAEAGLELLTSGTTGPPKHFSISYERLFSRMVSVNLNPATERVPALLFFPLGNISGVYILLPLVASDSPILVLDKYEVAGWLDYVDMVKPATVNLPPAAFRMILDAAVDPAALAPIEYINTGAATLDPTLRREFEARYDIPILQAYGATEFGGVVACITPAHIDEFGRAKSDSVGRPFGGASLRIVDVESGEPLPAGREGRLEVLAPAMSSEWIATTDLCLIDADGFLYHRGRLDGAIVRGGFKVIPEQVAEALASHPGVAAAAVVGVADKRLGEVPEAAIEPRDHAVPPSSAELEAHLRARLPSTMLPRVYHIVDHIPRTPSLKVDMAAVRALISSKDPF